MSRAVRRAVRDQYERFPYPPIPALALPRRGQGAELSYETGTRLCHGAERSHAGIRILVAGAGAFETLVVAQAHPRAAEIVAVDLSAASLARTRWRLRLLRLARPFARLPRVTLRHADLHEWRDPGKFDSILASNVLHHVDDPAALLGHLAEFLAPEGILRMVTYPKASRLWMRETGRFLRRAGLSPETPSLPARAAAAIRELSPEDPVRLTFETQGETRTAAGIVDAFLNACENPLSPREWQRATARAGLELAAEAQSPGSRSEFLSEILPETAALDAWTRLQILDDLLELCANPVLWLRRGPDGGAAHESGARAGVPAQEDNTLAAGASAPLAPADPAISARTPLHELSQGLLRAEKELARVGVTLERALQAFHEQVGPRVSAPPEEQPLPGLAASDYELSRLPLRDTAD
ncbi:MAG: class I SAM-dependent methyltransferase [Oligoflexia bacterium]|nr:class I SAM-dependent methyltransferase [Oligoflexia bacterium]